jgi:ABC-2 type transport system ATP-binding protein
VVASTRRLRIDLAAPDARLRDLLREAGLSVLEADERRAVAVLAGGEPDQARVLAQLIAAGLPVSGFAVEREDLQSSYMRTVGEKR